MNPTIDFKQTSRWTRGVSPRSVTIVALANRNVFGHEKAIWRTYDSLPFECKKLIVSMSPPQSDEIEWVRDTDWGEGRENFAGKLGEWTLKRLVNHITTDFAIIVQADGYATNPSAWTDEFFDYDYIGAPWPLWLTVFMKGSRFRRVGGAGFSFRSRKFLEATAALDYDPAHFQFEDIRTSRHYHKTLERMGCRFAPVDLALKWCIEYRPEDYPNWKPADSFGWHGLTPQGQPLYTMYNWDAFLGTVGKKLGDIGHPKKRVLTSPTA